MTEFWMKRRVRGLSRKTLKVLGTLVLVLVAARIALPYVAKSYINGVLRDDIEGYTGYVEDLDISLYRGAYQLQGLVLNKIQKKVPVPFVDIREIDFAVAWRPLFRGHVVGRVRLDRSSINFVNGPTPASSQSGAEGKGWRQAIDELFPLEIEEILVQRSEIHFRDFSKKPEIDLYLKDFEARVANLGNTDNSKERLVSPFRISSTIQKEGRFSVDGGLNLLEEPTTFDVNLHAKKINLVEFSEFFKAYAGFDIAAGQGDISVEAASVGGKIKGYVKPLIKGMKVLASQEHSDDTATVSDLGAGFVALVLRRSSTDTLATKVPFEGRLDDPKIGTWATVKSLFGNAFSHELRGGPDGSIDLSDARAVILGKKEAKKDSEERSRELRAIKPQPKMQVR